MNCSNCNNNKPIVNKRHNLCDDCNFMRLHNGQSKGEVYSDRAKAKVIEWDDKLPTDWDKQFKKKPKPIKQKSTKQTVRQQELSTLKKTIEVEALQNNEYYCWGCGQAKGGLDKSHILSVGQRKDLELLKENINLFCRACHMDWESGDFLRMISLLTFEKDLQLIKQYSTATYNKLLDALHYFIVHHDILNVDQQIIDKAHKISSENDFIIK